MTERDEDIINRITLARARNNFEWMRLLELALALAPEKAKCILRNINTNDIAISELLKDLAQ